MPITATLSRRFYDKLGDEVTNELVNWLNAVDQSYRQEFRDLFDANFGQLRAENEQLRVELKAELEQLRSELRAEFNTGIASLRAELLVVIADRTSEIHDRIGQGERRLLVWMIGLWLSSPLATAGIVLLMRQLGWL